MRSPEESWKAYTQQLKLDYADVISQATSEGLKTYDQYASQVGKRKVPKIHNRSVTSEALIRFCFSMSA